MYQEVTRDVGTLLQLFGRARTGPSGSGSGGDDPTFERLRRALAAVLAALRLRVVLCRWFLTHAQRPAHPRPEEQEVLLRLLLLQEMTQQQHAGPGAGHSPPTLSRLASGGSGVSAASLSSPASSPGPPPPPFPLLPPPTAPFFPSPKGGGAPSAAALLLDPHEAVEVVEEEVESVRARLVECGDGEEGDGNGAGALRAWAETAVLEAEALLSGTRRLGIHIQEDETLCMERSLLLSLSKPIRTHTPLSGL